MPTEKSPLLKRKKAEKGISLNPIRFEEALKGLLETEPPKSARYERKNHPLRE
jgi:hypothetical protein